jgi:hypothetical protein
LATESKFERDAEAIAENNPKVDLSMVREAQKLIAERRAQGWERRGYNLVSPHSRSLPAR